VPSMYTGFSISFVNVSLYTNSFGYFKETHNPHHP